ncbi:MAG: hypothetical protein ACRD0O_02745, partial [Acidimicrobiia bacterium]
MMRVVAKLSGAAVLLSVASPLVGAGRPVEAAGAPPAFIATAAADGGRFSMTVPNAPGTNTPIDGGGPSAQATVSSVGVSQAFASLPYPGDLPVRLPGLLAGVGVAGVPAYPLYAETDHPTAPEASVTAPGYSLRATSSEDRSAAEAAGEAPDGNPASYRSSAGVGPAGDGSIVAAADALARNLRIGDLVIGEAVSTAKVRLGADAAVERNASFELTGASIAGTAVSVGPGGVTLAGTGSPLPKDNPLFEGLAEQGISIEYIEPLQTPHGVVAGGVRVTVTGVAPDGTRGTGAMILGRATASIEAAALGGPPAVGVDLGSSETGPTDTAAVGTGPVIPDAGPVVPAGSSSPAPGVGPVTGPVTGLG